MIRFRQSTILLSIFVIMVIICGIYSQLEESVLFVMILIICGFGGAVSLAIETSFREKRRQSQ